ncbi:hypothetical protein JYU34_021520 [Plutella xylostella]|uniref:Major facilitator superfamily (MFS) profile domain-containing protein n=1 Tax=Plutella xylostella TaxID=51655 RepID=A0ABQ7PTS3_PLUXY|nr:hypothetical protein JYU34_021520 [Plutella xylostella]
MVSPFFKQSFVVVGAAMSQMGHGAAYGYTATLVAHYTDDQGNKMSNTDLSWIGSVQSLSKIVAAYLTPFIMSKMGRQRAHLLSVIPILMHWLIFVFGKSIPVFITGRVLFGISAGIYGTIHNIIIAESTDPVNRGAFSTLSSLAIGVGVLWVHVWGNILAWRSSAAVSTIIPCVIAVMTFFSPETPSWLVSKQRYDEARKSFRWLRGDSQEIQNEIEDLIENDKAKCLETLMKPAKTSAVTDKIKNILTVIKTKEFYHPICICVSMIVLIEFTGMETIMMSYGNFILKSLLSKNYPKDVKWHLNFLDFLRPVSTLLSIIILKKFKRKVILRSSALMTISSLIFTSVYVYIRNEGYFQQTLLLDIFVMCLMSLYTVSFYLGLSSLSFVIIGEIIPLSYRGTGSAKAMSGYCVITFILLKSFPQMYSEIGVEGIFLIFSFVCLISFTILYILLPETKDLTLLEIENKFKPKKQVLEVEMNLMNTS